MAEVSINDRVVIIVGISEIISLANEPHHALSSAIDKQGMLR